MTEPAAADRGDVWSAATAPEEQDAGSSEAGTPEAASPTEAKAPYAGRGETVAPISGVPVVRPGQSTSRPGRPARQDRPAPRQQPPDLLGGIERWLIRRSARSMRREIEEQVRRTFTGGGRTEPDDVWGTATTEPPDAAESPECAWCPICRAARRMRESGPGLGSQLTGVSDAVAAAVQDAVSAVDGVLSRSAGGAAQRPPEDKPAGPPHADSAADKAERASDEPGDRG
jgi:hypothetical protein